MPLSGKAVLAIWNGIAAEAEDAFLAWHVREHIPERVAVPGFLRGRRYVAHQGTPKYFNFYETRDVDVLSSPDYLARLNAPSPWTRQVVPHFTDTSRTICRVAASVGLGGGGWIGTLRMDVRDGADTFTGAMMREVIEPAAREPGIVAVHLLNGEPAASGGSTAEKAMRSQPDEIVGRILLVEATGPDALEHLFRHCLREDALFALGAHRGIRYGIYGLQFDLARGDLP